MLSIRDSLVDFLETLLASLNVPLHIAGLFLS